LGHKRCTLLIELTQAHTHQRIITGCRVTDLYTYIVIGETMEGLPSLGAFEQYKRLSAYMPRIESLLLGIGER
jgi:hypothetical protein